MYLCTPEDTLQISPLPDGAGVLVTPWHLKIPYHHLSPDLKAALDQAVQNDSLPLTVEYADLFSGKRLDAPEQAPEQASQYVPTPACSPDIYDAAAFLLAAIIHIAKPVDLDRLHRQAHLDRPAFDQAIDLLSRARLIQRPTPQTVQAAPIDPDQLDIYSELEFA